MEFAADHVITLARGKGDGLSMTTDPYELGVVQNRHGETGTVSIASERYTLRMVETETNDAVAFGVIAQGLPAASDASGSSVTNTNQVGELTGRNTG